MRFRSVLLAAAFLVSASLRADSPVYRQWVVTSAHATGAGREPFITSFRIVNRTNATATVDLYYLRQTPLDASHSALGDNSGAQKVTVTVNANQTLAIDDIVVSKFGNAAPAGGVLVISNI